MKTIATLLTITGLLYLAACAYLYFGQARLLYFPIPEVRLSDAERLTLTSDGEMLRIWRIGKPGAAKALVYFGGNAEDVAQNIPLFAQKFPAYAVYFVNYRGYGGSSGAPSEAALFKDATVVFDFVQERHTDVAVIGRSLGSGVAIFLATVREVKKLVLITPYDSIENVAKKQFPIFPVSLLLKDKFLSNSRAASIKVPTLVIIAENDEVIPRENSDALVSALTSARTSIVVLPGATHNTLDGSDEYARCLLGFL